jgi:hypothetical protein
MIADFNAEFNKQMPPNLASEVLFEERTYENA